MATVMRAFSTSACPGGRRHRVFVIAVELLGFDRCRSPWAPAWGPPLADFRGGVVRWAAEKAAGATLRGESDRRPGSLFASGLIAAGGGWDSSPSSSTSSAIRARHQFDPAGCAAFGPKIALATSNRWRW
jgi:hypothetical protein